MSVGKLLEQAIAAERQDRIDEAARFYAEVLRLEPTNFDGLHGLGVICCRQGKLEDAEGWLLRAAACDPPSAYAHINLGSVLFALKRDEAAIAHYEQALAIMPEFADAHNFMASALMRRGRLDEARRHWDRTLQIKPDYPEAHNNLGVLLQQLGRQADGMAHFEAALKIRPDYPDALNNYGAGLMSRGEPARALECCVKAVKLRHDFPEAHNGMGNALISLGRPREAIERFRTAISLRPNFLEAYNNLATALVSAGNFDEAIECLQKTLVLDPTYAEPHAKLGSIWLTLGRLDAAQRECAMAVQLAPTNSKYHLNLAELKSFDVNDPHLGILEKMLTDPMLGEEQQSELHFALSKAYSDFADYETAARHMVKANSLKRRLIDYDEDAALRELIKAEEIFTPELMQRHAGAGNPSSAPIFIVGMPRSGTTLIEQILASHEHVFGAGELGLLSDSIEMLPGKIRADLRYPEIASELPADLLRHLGDDYVRAITDLAPTALRITDKMPGNFRFVGLINLALPNARIIHARRDPLDTCLSCYSILFDQGQAFAYNLGELGRLYKAYERLMRHWRDLLPDGVMLEIQYEDLIGNFEFTARRVLQHCGLDWSPACLEFHKTRRAVRTASATQVREPLYSKAVGRWRPYAAMLAPLIEELGLPQASTSEQLHSTVFAGDLECRWVESLWCRKRLMSTDRPIGSIMLA